MGMAIARLSRFGTANYFLASDLSYNLYKIWVSC